MGGRVVFRARSGCPTVSVFKPYRSFPSLSLLLAPLPSPGFALALSRGAALACPSLLSEAWLAVMAKVSREHAGLPDLLMCILFCTFSQKYKTSIEKI